MTQIPEDLKVVPVDYDENTPEGEPFLVAEDGKRYYRDIMVDYKADPAEVIEQVNQLLKEQYFPKVFIQLDQSDDNYVFALVNRE